MSIKKHFKNLKSIIKDLESINKFTSDHYYKLNKTVAEINRRVDLNSKKVERYQSLRKTADSLNQNVKNVDLGLDISSENFLIYNMKHELVDSYIKDIYDRIDTLGDAISQQSKILIKVLEKIEAKDI